MMFFLFLFLLSSTFVLADARSALPEHLASVHSDRLCGGNLTNLWLEVVAVVDNSMGMTNQGLSDVAANIVSVFANSRIGINPLADRTTRVGIVTYSAAAQTVANLDQFQSTDDLFDGVFAALSQVSNTEESYLANGLFAAEQVLAEGRKSANRSQFQQVVIVYASTYKGTGELSPLPVAERLRAHGVTVITVAYNQGGGDDSLMAQLAKIATPHNNFSNTDLGGNVLGEIQSALLQANCYCPNGWTPLRQVYTDVFSYRYGVCLQAIGLQAIWRAAQHACQNRRDKSHLVVEFNADKHNYVMQLVQNFTGVVEPYTYHIGLSLFKGKWSWEQAKGSDPIPIDENGWTHWNPDFPIASSTFTAGLNQQWDTELKTGWQNVDPLRTGANYVCQVVACDTENFCDSE